MDGSGAFGREGSVRGEFGGAAWVGGGAVGLHGGAAGLDTAGVGEPSSGSAAWGLAVSAQELQPSRKWPSGLKIVRVGRRWHASPPLAT